MARAQRHNRRSKNKDSILKKCWLLILKQGSNRWAGLASGREAKSFDEYLCEETERNAVVELFPFSPGRERRPSPYSLSSQPFSLPGKYRTCRKQISAKLRTADSLIFCTNLKAGTKNTAIHWEYWIMARAQRHNRRSKNKDSILKKCWLLILKQGSNRWAGLASGREAKSFDEYLCEETERNAVVELFPFSPGRERRPSPYSLSSQPFSLPGKFFSSSSESEASSSNRFSLTVAHPNLLLSASLIALICFETNLVPDSRAYLTFLYDLCLRASDASSSLSRTWREWSKLLLISFPLASILFATSFLDCLFNGQAVFLGKMLCEIAETRFNNLCEVIS